MLTLIAPLYLWERRYAASEKSREQSFVLTYGAHCIHRAGDLCTHPTSAVNRPPRRTLLGWLAGQDGRPR